MKHFTKILLMAMLAVVLMVAALPFGVSAEDDASVSVSSASGKAGDTVTVNVDLSQNPGVASLELNVGYDTKQLELVDVHDSGILNGFASPAAYNDGNYKLCWENGLATTNNNGTGTVATLTFKLKEDCDKANVSISGKGYDTDLNRVGVSGSSGTITNTTPTTTTTTTTQPSTTKPTTTAPSSTTAKKPSTTTTKPSTTRKPSTTAAMTRSPNENTYPVDFYDSSTTEIADESTTDLLSLWDTMTTAWSSPATMSQSTTTELNDQDDNADSKLSKSKLILIILMACCAVIGIAIIISWVLKSKA